jgi:hypothetical protein
MARVRTALVPSVPGAPWALALALALALAACARSEYQSPDAADDDDPIDARVDARIDAPSSQCSRQPCSILPQCGCEATSATPVCDLDFDNLPVGATECRADNFHGTEATVCSRATTCAAEHVCLGRCRRYCDDDDDCPGAGGLCIVRITTGNPPVYVPDVTTCTTDCAPTQVPSAACPPSWGCHIAVEAGGAQRFFTDCEPAPPTGGNAGDVCVDNGDCRPGLDCITFNMTSKQCRPSCICPGGVCGNGTCPPGTGTCRALSPNAVIGPVTYGSCHS